LHPDFSGGQVLRETLSCAPVVSDAPRVEPVWQGLARRAGAMGLMMPEPMLTGDPDLHILAGSRRIDPTVARDGRYAFVIPPGGASLRLMSRSTRPSAVCPWIEDRRRLGVLVRRIGLRSGSDRQEVPMDGPVLGRGWWAVERDGDGPSRWTSGEAELPDLPAGVLTVEVAGAMRYLAGDGFAVGGGTSEHAGARRA
jgi:hypothetical protein